jgi:CheY-like chemotaxis protein
LKSAGRDKVAAVGELARPAECNSAIRQIANLRYPTTVKGPNRTTERGVESTAHCPCRAFFGLAKSHPRLILRLMRATRINILHVEDDPNDALLFQHACKKADVGFELQAVSDGDEAVAYLRGTASFADRSKYPLPDIILLDLKMPRLSGFDLLTWLRKDASFKKMPVIVLTSSNHETDIKRAYDLGANSYLVKPVGFDALVEVARTIHGYWLTLNRVPTR